MKKSVQSSTRGSAKALLPLFFFLILFMGAGVYFTCIGKANAFYQLPAPIAIIPAIVLAMFLSKDSLSDTTETFMQGAGQTNIIAMCLIFLLAGAFSSITTSIGAVQSTVNLGLHFIPTSFLVPGLFLIGCVVSMAMGTSVGTIAALAPIALGIANEAHIPLALTAGSVMSGAMFGDNLSVISDTTIAATRTQGALMQDKFKENFLIALPAALVAIAIYHAMNHVQLVNLPPVGHVILTFPYLAILVLSLLGVNVFLALLIGIASAGVIGVLELPAYPLHQFTHDVMQGFAQNQEIFILSILIGGLGYMVDQQGGLTYLKTVVMRFTQMHHQEDPKKQRRLAEIAIAVLIAMVNLFTANNTISIVVVGNVARDLAVQGGVSPRRAASLLDIFSCVIQGLIPYGFQALLLASIFLISPLKVVSYAFYPILLGVVSVATMAYGRK